MAGDRSSLPDGARYLTQFADRVVVQCPSCAGAAIVTGHPIDWRPERARVTCQRCGFSLRPPEAEWRGPVAGQAGARRDGHAAWIHRVPIGPHDPHVGLPLRYQRDVAGRTLWAYNRDHLLLLLEHVGARHRRRTPNVNQNLPSRLPRWMTSAKNRDAVVRAIEEMLDEPE